MIRSRVAFAFIGIVCFSFIQLASLFLSPPVVVGQEHEGELRLSNEYISIIVNSTDENTGRFAVETTGGNPDLLGDEDSPLIYRMPGQLPWTSYATIRVDGTDYVFGGPPTERAGRHGRVGEQVIAPQIVDDHFIETAYLVGPVQVTQVLSIIRSSTTGLLDTARIEYRVDNTDDTEHSVGIRLMIDTMLGSNDGAPFRVEELAVTTDSAFFGAQIPSFWQAFDSLSDPRVTAQGTLTGPDVTSPHRVYFSNWGALADGLWEFDFEPTRNFTRLGEFQLDSAMALYWDPEPIPPGESRSYVTHYGLGGISISPGQLSIGVTSPSSVTGGQREQTTFPIVAYVQNTGEGEARDVIVTLDLPDGQLLPMPGETLVRNVGHLPSGRTAQVTWQVGVDERFATGETSYTVRVEAVNAEPNEVSRTIHVASPAHIVLRLVEEDGHFNIEDGRLQPLPYVVRAEVENVGGTDAGGVWVKWDAPVGLQLSAGDRKEKPLGPVAAGEKTDVFWHIVPGSPPFTGKLTYTIQGEMAEAEEDVRISGTIDVPPLDAEVRLVYQGHTPIRPGDLFSIRVDARSIRQFYGADVTVVYDPGAFRLVGGRLGVDRGPIFSQYDGLLSDDRMAPAASGWFDPRLTLSSSVGKIRFGGDRAHIAEPAIPWADDWIATLHFQAIQPGSHTLEFEEVWIDQLRMTNDGPEISRIKVNEHPLHIIVNE